MSPAAPPLVAALAIVRRRKRSTPPLAGAALAALRRQVHDGAFVDDVADAPGVREAIIAVTVDDMPPPVDLLEVLVETLAQRLGGVNRAEAWRSIGVKADRGRSFLDSGARTVDYPIWYTLREHALATRRARR